MKKSCSIPVMLFPLLRLKTVAHVLTGSLIFQRPWRISRIA